MAQTLLLDPNSWDLLVDADRNVAVASEPWSLAQDAASAIRLFLGEQYYDTTKGVPYFQQILGKTPPLSYVKAQTDAQALSVPDVKTAKTFISTFTQRGVAGQVQVTGTNGQTAALNF